jgi:FG-GAP repeat
MSYGNRLSERYSLSKRIANSSALRPDRKNLRVAAKYLVLIFAGLFFSSQLALAQFKQQAPKLVGTGAIGQAGQGGSVALSADGNTAIVGGDADNGIGAAWVFTQSGGVWTQQAKLVGTGAIGIAEQGFSVALSGDGNTAIVGGPDDNNQAGAAWVFTQSGGFWTQQGAKLFGGGAVGAAQQGWAIALSGDGKTAIAGGYSDNGFAGAAWVFTQSNGVWSQQGSKLIGTGAIGQAEQGGSVSLSADGNTAIVGGPNTTTRSPGRRGSLTNRRYRSRLQSTSRMLAGSLL